MNILLYHRLVFLVLFLQHASFVHSQEIEFRTHTYLGNEKRNYYGNELPNSLSIVWEHALGQGISPAYGGDKIWKGAGWTGQALIVSENNRIYLIQPSFDYGLKKIDAENGMLIWDYKFDDILKGSPTIWFNAKANDPEWKYVILQGSRRGAKVSIDAKDAYSFRGISYLTGKEMWRFNVERTLSYSRDVDASALVINDTAYIPLENGYFAILNPGLVKKSDGYFQPHIYKKIKYFEDTDTLIHGTNIECESSPVMIGRTIYTATGTGRIIGYNLDKRDTTWCFNIGADLNGTPVATADNKLIIAIEKDYIAGPGGALMLDPSKAPSEAIVWYLPTLSEKWFHWHGGIVGSVAVNDATADSTALRMAAIIGTDGYLTVVAHNMVDTQAKSLSFNGKDWLPSPRILSRMYIGGAISTPLFIHDKILVAHDTGLVLLKVGSKGEIQILDKIEGWEIDATPVVYNKRIYVAVKNGMLYCIGEI